MAESFNIETNDEVENFVVDFGEVVWVTNNDFNKLENRPSYAGEVMTGETSIPEVPSAVSELTNDANYQTGAQVETAIGAERTARENADTALNNRLTTVEGIAGTALQPESINKVVMTDIAVGSNTSTTTFNLEAAKENLLTGATSSKQVSMPVASSTEAGIMNSSTFDAVSNNTSNINALLNGAVAITGLPADPTQAQLTTAWETATGATALMNRAGIYDVTNGKVWTYYTNSATWYSVTNTTQVTINTFTNNSEGTIKGSTNVGQIFAESDGTGSVNGWDALNDTVSNNTSDIADLETALGGKQDKLIAGENINIASDGKTISATDTTYTAGSGINISSQNVISTDAPEGFFTLPATVEEEGSEITLNNTIGAKLAEVQVDGDTYQTTYAGKNLYNPNDSWSLNLATTPTFDESTQTTTVAQNTSTSSGTRYARIIIPVIPGGTYTLSAANITRTESITHEEYVRAREYRDGAISQVGYSISPTSLSNTFTVADNCTSLYLYLYVGQNETIEGATMTVQELQVNEGAAMAYEPYTGGIPSPSPDYPQKVHTVTGEQLVKIHGKNLINIPNFTSSQQGIDAKGSNQTIELTGTAGNTYYPDFRFYANGTYGSRAYRSNVNQIDSSRGFFTEPNSEYKLSIFVEGDTPYAIVEGFETKVTNNLGLVGGQVITINDSEKLNFVSISISQNVTANIKVRFQIEKSSTATAYEPYQSQSYPISLGSIELCKIGEHQDYIYKNGNDWYLHKAIGKYTMPEGKYFLGISGSSAGPDTQSAVGTFSFLRSDIGNDVYDDFMKNARLCSLAIYSNVSVSGNTDVVNLPNYAFTERSGTNDRIYYRNTSLTGKTGREAGALFANSSWYGFLDTPTDTQITDTTLVGQLEALVNATSCDGQTNFAVISNGDNLPAILEVKAYQKSLNGILGVIERTNG